MRERNSNLHDPFPKKSLASRYFGAKAADTISKNEDANRQDKVLRPRAKRG
jgi:hypothetical protein